MRKPKVTISIPTYNSERTLDMCLKAIRTQTYSNISVNLVDKESTDRTLKIAKKYKVDQVINFPGSLLAARSEGVSKARGKYVLILDSDQVLETDTIERAVEMIEKEKLDMLTFEEDVYKAENLVEKLFRLDRKLIEGVCDLSPFSGVIMPRFFRTQLIKKAYGNIPKEMKTKLGGPDHAVVYYEAWKISKKLGVLKKAVLHIEPSSMQEIVRKCFRWGYTGSEARYGPYAKLMARKERFRAGLFTRGLILESFGSIAITLMKGIPYKLGKYFAMVDNWRGIKRY